MAKIEFSLFNKAILVRAILNAFVKLNPLYMAKNPVMFVTEIGALIVTIGLFVNAGESTVYFCALNSALALVHGALCQLRGGPGGRAWQGTGRRAQKNTDKNNRTSGKAR